MVNVRRRRRFDRRSVDGEEGVGREGLSQALDPVAESRGEDARRRQVEQAAGMDRGHDRAGLEHVSVGEADTSTRAAGSGDYRIDAPAADNFHAAADQGRLEGVGQGVPPAGEGGREVVVQAGHACVDGEGHLVRRRAVQERVAGENQLQPVVVGQLVEHLAKSAVVSVAERGAVGGVVSHVGEGVAGLPDGRQVGADGLLPPGESRGEALEE